MTAPAQPAPVQPATARHTAFVNLPVDFLLVGGLSVIHLALFSSAALREAVTSTLGMLFGPALAFVAAPFNDNTLNVYDAAVVATLLTWAINHPHFSATSHRLYRNRESMMQFPVTAFGVPALLFVLLTAALLLPQTVAPWFVKVFLIWSPYHFSAQTLGITMLYARRAGFHISPALRKALVCFIFGTYLGPTLAAEGYAGLPQYYGVNIPTFGLPPDFFILYKTLVQVAGAVCAVLLAREAWKQDKRIPLLLVVPAIAQYFWFIMGAGVNGFQEFVPAYHSLQYLLIAWAINLKERTDEGRMAPTPGKATFESMRWFCLNVAGGVFLFYALPKLAGWQFNLELGAAAGITLAAVQIHHFFVDGVIWKLRNPRVSQPLMTTWSELSGRRPV